MGDGCGMLTCSRTISLPLHCSTCSTTLTAALEGKLSAGCRGMLGAWHAASTARSQEGAGRLPTPAVGREPFAVCIWRVTDRAVHAVNAPLSRLKDSHSGAIN